MSDPTASRNALLKILSGSFSNQQQAFDNPPLYAHILVRFRPAPQLAPGSLLLEQAYAIAPNESPIASACFGHGSAPSGVW